MKDDLFRIEFINLEFVRVCAGSYYQACILAKAERITGGLNHRIVSAEVYNEKGQWWDKLPVMEQQL